MITTFYPPHHFGGDGVAVRHLAEALASQGHAVTVICDVDAWRAAARGAEPVVPDDPVGITVIRLRSRFGVLGPLLTHQAGRPTLHAAEIRAIVAAGRFDVVHFHNVSLIGGPGILSVAGPGPVTLYTAHEHWLVCPTHILWRHGRELCDARECTRCQLRHRRPPQLWRSAGALSRALRHVDVFLANSEFSARKHREFGFPRPMTVLPPGLPDLPLSAGSDPPHPRPFVLVAGRLEGIKGVDDAITAIGAVPGVDLLVAGQGSALGALQAQVADRADVRFLGQLDQDALAAVTDHALAAVAPSRVYETFGVVVAEAFRASTPVIARRLGPYPELVEQAGGGWLFDDVAGLAGALREVVGDPAEAQDRGRRGRAAWEARWSMRAVLPRYLGIIESARS